HDAEYGVWRPVYKRHAYHEIHFDEVPEKNRYAFSPGAPNQDADFPKPLEPVDDLPPLTVITHVGRREGKMVVRGTATDNGTIRRVLVNGREAQALAPNFAEWEVVLDTAGSGEVQVTAQ